jgi:HK97 family phage major capsid protein
MLDAYRQETRFQFAEAGFHGGGLDRPIGILDSANPAKLEVAIEGGQTAKILFENVLKMHNRMIPNQANNYKWFINPEMLDYLPFMKITIGDAGQAVFLPSNITGTLYGTLLGKELVPCEQCSAPGTVGDIVLANFSQYGALAEGGERSDMSTHVYFLTDETAFRFINYMGGKPLRHGPITPKRGSNGFKFADFITLGAR